MAKRTVHLHIGPPSPAAEAVHDGLLQQRFALSAAGFHVPATSAYDALAVEIELCRTHREHGLKRAEVEGTWARMARDIWRSPRPALVSIPGLAAAPPDGRALVFDALAGLKIHLVLTPPDPGTALTTAWRTTVQGGRRASFAKFARRALDPERAHEQSALFRSTYDLSTVLEAWAARTKPQRVHIVTTPPAGSGAASGELAWQRFTGLLGLDATDPAADLATRPVTEAVTPPPADPRESAAQVAVLRRLNRALDGRLSHPAYAAVVGPLFGDVAPLALPDLEPDPRTAPLAEVLTALAQSWTSTVLDRGHTLHGDLDDLLPRVPEVAPHPDQVSAKDQLEVAADLLAEALLDLARLRRDNELLTRGDTATRRSLLRRRTAAAPGA